MPLILRQQKGSPLTNSEVDGNFTYLDTKIDDQVDGLNQKIDLETVNLQGQVNQKLNASAVGVTVAPLADGKVPLQNIPESLLSGLSYKGLWNAATNSPDLTSVQAAGHFYIVSVGGSRFGIEWKQYDWIISDGSAWTRYHIEIPTSEILDAIGTDPNKIPLNQMLGSYAYMNLDQFTVKLNPAAAPYGKRHMVFELPDPGTLKIKVMLDDGTVKSATISLS